MSFDSIAPWYPALEWIAFGDDLQRCRVACLHEITVPRHALIVGEGNGRFLCELLRSHPEIEVDCVDASQRMLQLARKRVEDELPRRSSSVRFLRQNIESWMAPERHYDLLVTHFFLDCFPEPILAEIIRKLARSATENANWLVGDFSVPRDGLARLRARCWLTAMYSFFRVTTQIQASELVDSAPFLRAEGFVLVRQHLLQRGVLKSEIWTRAGAPLWGD